MEGTTSTAWIGVVFFSAAMAAETRAVNDPEKIHADVLLNAREACYKVASSPNLFLQHMSSRLFLYSV